MAWFLIVFGFALAVASFAIEAMAPLRNPWLGLLAGLILTVVGIVVLESRPRPRTEALRVRRSSFQRGG